LPILRLNPKVGVEDISADSAYAGHGPGAPACLKQPVANLAAQRDDILAALDFLFTGY
jgi:toxin CcdB